TGVSRAGNLTKTEVRSDDAPHHADYRTGYVDVKFSGVQAFRIGYRILWSRRRNGDAWEAPVRGDGRKGRGLEPCDYRGRRRMKGRWALSASRGRRGGWAVASVPGAAEARAAKRTSRTSGAPQAWLTRWQNCGFTASSSARQDWASARTSRTPSRQAEGRVWPASAGPTIAGQDERSQASAASGRPRRRATRPRKSDARSM